MSDIIREELPEVPYGVLSGQILLKKLRQVCLLVL